MGMFQEYYVNTLKNNYANFDGRARRSEYWYYNLFNILVVMACYAIMGIGIATEISALMMIGSGIVLIVALGTLIPSLALAVRRLHDTNKSGWMILIGLIPLIGSIALLVFYCTDGTPGPNQYGSNPKEIDGGSSSDHLLAD